MVDIKEPTLINKNEKDREDKKIREKMKWGYKITNINKKERMRA